MVETEDNLSKIVEEDLKQLLRIKNLNVSLSHEDNLNTLGDFCRLDYGPDHFKQARTPCYQPLVNALLMECYKRRVAATNQDSQREYRHLHRYACEWRYGSALLMVLIILYVLP
jgi:hypothetical protein